MLYFNLQQTALDIIISKTASKPVPEGLTESELDSSSSKIHCRQSYTKQNKDKGEKALQHFSYVSGAHRKTA